MQNLVDGERHIPVKAIESFDGTYIQFDTDSDTYFKAVS